jgi:hypothetical protein
MAQSLSIQPLELILLLIIELIQLKLQILLFQLPMPHNRMILKSVRNFLLKNYLRIVFDYYSHQNHLSIKVARSEILSILIS